jgi:hypothetical protein
MRKPAVRQDNRSKLVEQFAADVLESIRQMKRGEVAQVHRPEDITARRSSPLSSVIVAPKHPSS